MIYNTHKALASLKPNTNWGWSGMEYSGLDWQDSSTKPTESEIDAEVTRLNNLESMKLLRVERDERLAACDWRASSDLTRADTWKTYRQALRDLPSISTPTLDSDGDLDMSSVNFPTEPS